MLLHIETCVNVRVLLRMGNISEELNYYTN